MLQQARNPLGLKLIINAAAGMQLTGPDFDHQTGSGKLQIRQSWSLVYRCRCSGKHRTEEEILTCQPATHTQQHNNINDNCFTQLQGTHTNDTAPLSPLSTKHSKMHPICMLAARPCIQNHDTALLCADSPYCKQPHTSHQQCDHVMCMPHTSASTPGTTPSPILFIIRHIDAQKQTNLL